MTLPPGRTTSRRHPAALMLRVLVAAGLLVDAAVHLHLAPRYEEASPDGVGLGTLFVLQAVAALATAIYVLTRGTRRAYLAGFLVAGAAVAAVLTSRYVDLPAIGPLPAMYEPVWYVEKAASAIAEVVTAALALTGLIRIPAGRPRNS